MSATSVACLPVFVLALSGCAPEGQCPPGFLRSDEACVFDEPSVLDLVGTMSEGALVQVNREPYMPPMSATPILRNVWVSPVPVVPDCDTTAADTVAQTAPELYFAIDQEGWGPALEVAFPVGTVIIHEAVNREEAHGVEVKRDDYVDDLGRDWWLRMVYDDGTIDDQSDDPYAQPCSSCHNEGVRVTEGLWGIPAAAK